MLQSFSAMLLSQCPMTKGILLYGHGEISQCIWSAPCIWEFPLERRGEILHLFSFDCKGNLCVPTHRCKTLFMLKKVGVKPKNPPLPILHYLCMIGFTIMLALCFMMGEVPQGFILCLIWVLEDTKHKISIGLHVLNPPQLEGDSLSFVLHGPPSINYGPLVSVGLHSNPRTTLVFTFKWLGLG